MVEFALVLPLLLLITAGVLEVGNMLTLYNRVSLAAREGARFIATGGDAEDVVTVIEQSSAGSLYFDDEHTCIYVIHAQVNSAGTGWGTSWTDTMVYPTSGGCLADPDTEGSGVDPTVVWDQIEAAPDSSAGLANLEVVVVAMRYNADTLLSLPIFPQLQGRVPIQAFTAMRLEATVEAAAGKPTDGCHAYPIAIKDTSVSLDDRTLYEAYQNEAFDLDRYDVDEENEDFDDLFVYLRWNGNSPTPACCKSSTNFDGLLAKSLDSPGNSLDATCGFKDALDSTDTSLHEGDYVRINGSPGSLTLTEMFDHICPTGDWDPPSDCGNERALRVMVWKSTEDGHDLTSGYVEIEGFIIIRPIDVDTDLDPDYPLTYLTFEFVRWDHSCGQT
jgi:hypothetical protein